MYKEISSEVKVEVVKACWQRGNISDVSNEFGISRKTIYRWLKICEGKLKEAFEEEKPGQGKKVSLSEQNRQLKEQVSKLFLILHKEGKEITEIPVVCPKCQGSKIRKNGKIFTNEYGLRERYLCGNCFSSIYVSLKKTL